MNSITISFKRKNCSIIKTHSFLHQIMTIITYFWIKSTTYLKKVSVIANNALMRTIGLVDIDSFGHINHIKF